MQMDTFSSLPQRKSNRLHGYDYSEARCYFITICTYNRMESLSRICRGDPRGRPQVQLTALGQIADAAFLSVQNLYGVSFDKSVMMPNHVHFILNMAVERATARVAPTVGQVVGAYKSIIAREWIALCSREGLRANKIWQRNYYDHIIRKEQDYREIWNYIDTNPLKWDQDRFYTNRQE